MVRLPHRHALAVDFLEGLRFHKIGLVLDEAEQRQGPEHLRPSEGWDEDKVPGLFKVRPLDALEHGARPEPPEVISRKKIVNRRKAKNCFTLLSTTQRLKTVEIEGG